MNLSYKLSNKELLAIRNKIFVDNGIPILKQKGFVQSPFSTARFGTARFGVFYELCRLKQNSQLEMLLVKIVEDDRWIQIYLNIFKLHPKVVTIEQLHGIDGVKYHLRPNDFTKLRLKSDEIKGMPLFNYDFWLRNHKLKCFFTKKGFDSRVKQLGAIIKEDMSRIDYFIDRWSEICQHPFTTSWDGTYIKGSLPEALKGTLVDESYYGKDNIPINY
ncbi:MAG: hypothetical protein ACK5IJ_11850 [Mangrovibacterium sp.]